jgi:hypothetical protein
LHVQVITMEDFIENKVQSWIKKDGNDQCSKINRIIKFLEEKLFYSYEPTRWNYPEFRDRLEDWLKNISTDNDQKALFKSLPYIFYIGEKEFIDLYRFAYNGPIARWMIEETGILLNNPNAYDLLRKGIENTYFLPVTDSLRINMFFHLNNIHGSQDLRPDLRSLAELGDYKEIKKWFLGNKVKRLVLLEDFVGSGEQSLKAISKLAKTFSNLDILFVPLVICPKGVDEAKKVEGNFKNLTISPTVKLKPENFVSKNKKDNKSKILLDLFVLADKYYVKTTNGIPIPQKPYHPLGFEKTGGLVVMFTNTPDNTLPLFHWTSDSWKPLFPRHARV